MIAFVASDLLWSSRIKATADTLGVPTKRIFNAEGLNAVIETGNLRLVLIDLESEDADEIIAALRGPNATDRARETSALAWAPHVLVEVMHKASNAGIERVLPRGAFSSKLEQIITEIR